MMYRVLILAFLFWVSDGNLNAYAQAPQGQPEAPAPTAEESQPVFSVPKNYKYSAQGRRDPFVNPVPKPTSSSPKLSIPKVRPPGLKGVLVSEASIAGVVTSKEPSMTVVVIKAPGGNSYFAHVGDALYDATVKEIRLDSVTFTVSGKGAGRDVVRKVNPTPGEDK